MNESIWDDMTKKQILEDYTEYDRTLREHIEKFPKKIPAWFPTETHTGHYISSQIDEWVQQLKNKIGGYESIVTHETRSQEEKQ